MTGTGGMFPPLYGIPVFLACGLVGAVLLRPVRLYLAARGVDAARHRAVAAGIWLFAVTGLLIVLSPGSLVTRAGMLLMSGFLLQLGVMDAVSGWLPRPWTVSCLCGGLLFTLAHHHAPLWRMAETGVTGLVVWLFFVVVNRRREQLGAGDAWLLTGLTAWVGLADMLSVAVTGLSGFLLWQWVPYRDVTRAGVLGPWLCAGGVPVIIGRLYQPLWIV